MRWITASSSAELGKNIGDDLAEGKPTLPLIHAMQNGSPAEARLIREAIEQGGLDQIDAILRAIESTGALEYTARSAEKEAAAAIGALAEIPDSDYKNALRRTCTIRGRTPSLTHRQTGCSSAW